MKNLRAVTAWIGTPVGVVAVWVAVDWFLSTRVGGAIGLAIAIAALVTLALAVAAAIYALRK